MKTIMPPKSDIFAPVNDPTAKFIFSFHGRSLAEVTSSLILLRTWGTPQQCHDLGEPC